MNIKPLSLEEMKALTEQGVNILSLAQATTAAELVRIGIQAGERKGRYHIQKAMKELLDIAER